MKKTLCGSTALVAASLLAGGAAVAQEKKPSPVKITVGGYFEAYYTYVDQDDDPGEAAANRRSHGIEREAEIRFRGRTTLDNGMTVGVDVQLEAETCADQIDESYLFMEAQFGRVEIGATDSAANKMWYGAPTPITGHGINTPNFLTPNPGGNLAFSPTTYVIFGNGDSEKATYFTPRLAGFQFGISYTPDGCEENAGGGAGAGGAAVGCGGSFGGLEPDNAPAGQSSEILELGLNYTGSLFGFDISAFGGYGKAESEAPVAGVHDDNRQYAFGAAIGIAGFTIGASYRDNDNLFGLAGVDQTDYNAGISYAEGPWTVGFQYHHVRVKDSAGNIGVAGQKDELDGYSLGAIYALGPGVVLTGGIQYFDWKSSTNLPVNENEAFQVLFGTRIDF